MVVHELVHLENRNHEEKFWSKLKQVYPEYEKPYTWLKENSHRLVYSKKDYLKRY